MRSDVSAKQQIQLERKEDMKSRGLASPDLGDCLAMSFAVKVAARQRPFANWRPLQRDQADGCAWMA